MSGKFEKSCWFAHCDTFIFLFLCAVCRSPDLMSARVARETPSGCFRTAENNGVAESHMRADSAFSSAACPDDQERTVCLRFFCNTFL